jgi:hypothetical protein
MIEKLKDRVKYGKRRVRISKRRKRKCVRCKGWVEINKVVMYNLRRSICIECNNKYYKRGRKWLKREIQNQD